MTDPERLAAALRRDFSALTPSADRAWFRPLALRVIDCVLSMRQADERPIAPRLEAFRDRFPAVESVRDLADLLSTYRAPVRFAREVLETNDPAPAATLIALVDHFTRFALTGTGTETAQLKAWAVCARPQDYLTLRIPTLTLAGFQYLRMLLGANTLRPTPHLRRYILKVVGRPVSDVEAILLLEEAAPLVPLRLRDITGARWADPRIGRSLTTA
jgi:hypothetical protein